MRTRRRRRFLVLLFFGAAACGCWYAYSYFTDNGRLAALLRRHAKKYLRDGRLDVARVEPNLVQGEVVVTQATIWQVFERNQFLALKVPWLKVKQNPKRLAEGKFLPSEIVIVQPTLRIRRSASGQWNLDHLLSKTLPKFEGGSPPLVVVDKGTLELVTGDSSSQGVALLRDVSIRMTPNKLGVYAFEGSVRGDSFDRARVEGVFDPSSGKLTFKGDASRLVITQTLLNRLPKEAKPILERSGLTGGEIDLVLNKLEYDPLAKKKLTYDVSARLQNGVINCQSGPFPLSDVSAEASIKDGEIVIHRAEGYNGPTSVRAWGGGSLLSHKSAPFALNVQVADLEIDDRLKVWTPAEFAKIWDEYQPNGRANVSVHVERAKDGAEPTFVARIDCRDVGMRYHLFPYTIEHVHGSIVCKQNHISLEMRALVGGKEARAEGAIDNPGPNAHVKLMFHADALPIDKSLLDALPSVARNAVDQFQPTGTVKAEALVERTPPTPADPKGKVEVHASLDLDGRCTIRWSGLPYQVLGLTGKLVIEPDSWSFRDMKGENGQAEIAGEGWVKRAYGDKLAGEIHLKARNLPFDQQLHDALPEAWRISWKRLNPVGSCRVDAKIGFDPNGQTTHLEIVPEHDTRVRLEINTPKTKNDPGGLLVFPPMEDVRGLFVFHNGTVTMTDVGFHFHNASVRLSSGVVRVEDTGKFDLAVRDLAVSDFRLDSGVRQIMPKLMAQFALRLDDGKTLAARTKQLRIGWSGEASQSAWCSWKDALVVFNGNTISSAIPIEHMQGQIDHVEGMFAADKLWTKGNVRLASVSLMGQQVTGVSSNVELTRDLARFKNVKGVLLGGSIEGAAELSLDSSPKYAAKLSVRDAELAEYAKTMPGRQTFRGRVSADVEFSGVGSDVHTLEGKGEGHLREGDLGTLPGFLRFVKVLNLSPATKTLFDTADVEFKIRNGQTVLNPIVFKGDAFSLHGSGTLDPQSELNLRLRILFGRDAIHIPLLSSATRALSGEVLAVRVTGPAAYPQFKLEALHPVSSILKRPLERMDEKRVNR